MDSKNKIKKGFVCTDSRSCGGRDKITKKCRALEYGYPDGVCPFCKPDFRVTNGKRYDPDISYGKYVPKYANLSEEQKKNVKLYAKKGKGIA